MKKHSKIISIIHIPDPINTAMLSYLLASYPGYQIEWAGEEYGQVSPKWLSKTNPHLLIIPGNGQEYLSRESAKAVRKYLANGGNIYAICNGVYRALKFQHSIDVDKKVDSCIYRHSLKISDCHCVHWKTDEDEHFHTNSMYRAVFAPNGQKFNIIYLNGPRILQTTKSRKDTTPILRCETVYGTAAQNFTYATVTRLSGGGRAVLSGLHFESPITTYMDSLNAWIEQAVDKKNTKQESWFRADMARTQLVYEKYLRADERHVARLRDYVYEDLLGLRR